MPPLPHVRRRSAITVSCLALLAFSAFAGASAHAACSPTSDSYAAAVLADSPLAYYRLDDASGPAMCDASATGASGTYAAGVTLGTAGALGSTSDTAASASDPSSGIGSGGAGVTGAASFTLEGWFRSNGTIQNQAVVAMGASATGQIAGITTWSNVGTSGYGADAGTQGPSELGLDTYSSSNHWDTAPTGVNIWDGAWHHLAIAFDHAANQLTAYVDGHALPAQTPSTTLNLGTGPILVGKWVDTTLNQPLLGSLDEVAVYPTALSAARIAAHYQAAGASTTPGTKRGSATSVTCTYSVLTSADTCTALVGDASTNATPVTPTGSVSFASPRGLFTLGKSCTLASSPTTPSIASCSVNYLPPDMYLPKITATYAGDSRHIASSGHTQYRGANGASTYESVFSPDPGVFPAKLGVTVPVAVAGSTVGVCVLAAGTAATSRAQARIPFPHVPLPFPELQGLTAELGKILGGVGTTLAQSKATDLLGQIVGGLPTAPEQRGGLLRQAFMVDLGGDVGKLFKFDSAGLDAVLAPLADLYVENIVGSLPLDPAQRADTLAEPSVKRLLDDIGEILDAEQAPCGGTAGQRTAVAAAKAKHKRTARPAPLARATRKHVKAGPLKITLRLNRKRLAKATRHRKRLRVAIVVNVKMPSALLPRGYPRTVVELVTLHKGKRKHKAKSSG